MTEKGKPHELNFIIDAMTIADLDQIEELEKLAFTMPWPRGAFEGELTNNALARYLVARKDNKVIGYIGIWLIFDEGHITNVAVHPDYRRQGVADALLRRMLSNAKGCDINSCTLEVRRSNLAAQELYKKFGFAYESVRPGYYTDNKEDALIFWKKDMSDMEPSYDWVNFEEENKEEGES